MSFHTFIFLEFFVVVVAVYWSLPSLMRHTLPPTWHHLDDRLRKCWLLGASCVFYATWSPWLIVLILLSAALDYYVALQLEKRPSAGIRRLWLVFSIGTNLGLLGFFKYANFFLSSTSSLLNLIGVPFEMPGLQVVVPLGISFYTFETISYVVDVNRGRIKALRNPLDYGLYIMFFPHLLAGPIVRPAHFLPQLRCQKRLDWDRMQLGLQYFLIGFFKKAVIADYMGTMLVQPVFADAGAFASSAIWLAVLAYAIQIYGDFSGYSDMAIGVAYALGYKLPFNFDMPYFASNISEFWRRWHISLSTWLRDYLYVPLGGSRCGTWKTYRNLFVTMLLGGLWHGASWTFVIWGFYHGLLLAIHRCLKERSKQNCDESESSSASGPLAFLQPIKIAGTFLSVCVGWVFFRAETFSSAGIILKRMAWPSSGQTFSMDTTMTASALFFLVLICHVIGTCVDIGKIERWLPAPILGAGLAGIWLLAHFLMPSSGAAFIYFQF